MSYAGNNIFLTAIIIAIFLQFFTPVHNGKHTCHYTKVIWTDNTALHQGWRIVRSSAEVLDKPSTEEEKKAQILLRIKAQIPYFMSALWFVYISRPRLILLSSQPCLNPKPVTHLSQPQFNLPGNGYIRLKLVIFSLQLLYWHWAFQLRIHTAEKSHSNHSQLNRLPHTGTFLNRCRLTRAKWTSNYFTTLTLSSLCPVSTFSPSL